MARRITAILFVGLAVVGLAWVYRTRQLENAAGIDRGILASENAARDAARSLGLPWPPPPKKAALTVPADPIVKQSPSSFQQEYINNPARFKASYEGKVVQFPKTSVESITEQDGYYAVWLFVEQLGGQGCPCIFPSSDADAVASIDTRKPVSVTGCVNLARGVIILTDCVIRQ